MRSENSQKIGQGILKYKDWIFGSIFLKDESPIEKENLNFEEKNPNLDVYGLNWIFMDLIGFLFEFIEDLIARKIDF